MSDLQTQQERTDSEHLNLLSIFHYVVAGVSALFACFPVLYLALGLFMIFAPEKMGGRNNAPPEFVGWMFIAFAAGFILAGWTFAVLVFVAGRFLSKRKGYNFCFVMACVECLFMPFGTILGVFTLLVLMRPSVKELFPVKA